MYKHVITDYNIPENPPLNHHYKENYRLYRNKVANICTGRRMKRWLLYIQINFFLIYSIRDYYSYLYLFNYNYWNTKKRKY